MRRGREKGDPGVWFGSRVCILAREGARGWRRKSAAIRHSDCTQSTFRAGAPAWGACPMLSQELSAEAGRQLSRFLVPEPGRAWLGPLWPNRGADFGPQRVAFWSSPHPSHRAYKRGSMEPLVSSLLGSLSHSSSDTIGVLLPERASSSLRAGSGATAVLRDSLPCCRRPASPRSHTATSAEHTLPRAPANN